MIFPLKYAAHENFPRLLEIFGNKILIQKTDGAQSLSGFSLMPKWAFLGPYKMFKMSKFVGVLARS